MQLIRPYQILCFLRNAAILGRQKFRAYRCVQHVQQNPGKLRVPAGIRIVTHQMAHQSLWDSSVYSIHGHMIPIVGCPPKGQLGHIPCSHCQTAVLIRNIHQNFSSLSGLCIFIGYIIPLRILSNIPEMGHNRLLNIDFPQSSSQLLCKLTGILIGPARGAKAGHGYTDNLLSWK